jgi:hypothetical protein
MSAPTQRQLRALLRSVERPKVVKLSSIINALAWLFVLSILTGMVLAR